MGHPPEASLRMGHPLRHRRQPVATVDGFVLECLGVRKPRANVASGELFGMAECRWVYALIEKQMDLPKPTT